MRRLGAVFVAVLVVAVYATLAAGSSSPDVVSTQRVTGANGHTFTTVAFLVPAGAERYLCVVTEDSSSAHTTTASQPAQSIALAQSCDFSTSR